MDYFALYCLQQRSGSAGQRDSRTSLAESEVLSSNLPPLCFSFPFPPHQRQTGSASVEAERNDMKMEFSGKTTD